MPRRFDDDEVEYGRDGRRRRDAHAWAELPTGGPDRSAYVVNPRPAPPPTAKCVHCVRPLGRRATVTYPVSGLTAHLACTSLVNGDAIDAALVAAGRIAHGGRR